jgi:hypothetical protein
MTTLILSRRYSDDSNAMWRAALAAGWGVERLLSYGLPEGLAIEDPVLYGETILADAIAGALGLRLIEPSWGWLPALPEPYRRRAVRLCTLGEARSLQGPLFLKPVDEKIFKAAVYARGDEADPTRALADSEAVLVAEPVRWGVEVRVFLRERQVATLSAYIRDGEIARDAQGNWPLSDTEEAAVRAFLGELLADPAVELPPAVVIDVGEIVGRGWAVVEANAAWASGLCGCDPEAALRVVRRASVPAAGLSEGDRPWLRPTPEGLRAQRGWRTSSTEQGASRAIRSATEPSRKRSTLPGSWVPTTITSAPRV